MTATMTKRTPKQQLADILRRKNYAGCHGQVTVWHNYEAIELFATDTPDNRRRFPLATVNQQGMLKVAEIKVSS